MTAINIASRRASEKKCKRCLLDKQERNTKREKEKEREGGEDEWARSEKQMNERAQLNGDKLRRSNKRMK